MNETAFFRCVGVPVRADETRSAAVCRNGSGQERVVIASRGYVLIVNPLSGDCRQVPFPEGHVDYPFASISDRNGLFYTGAGRMLMVLDPFAARYVCWFRGESVPDEEILGFAFAETEDGAVFASTYPGCMLLRIDVHARQCFPVVRLDPEQHYAMTLAADRAGWLYAGIGTQEARICAYHPASGVLKRLCAEEGASPTIGSGLVQPGTDGEVYASLPAAGTAEPSWFRLAAGSAVPVPAAAAAPSVYHGNGYQKLFGNISGGRRIISWQLAEGELVVEEADGRTTVIPLAYEGAGTSLSPMTAGADGRLYGTSNHPLHLYRYDPKENELLNFGGKVVEKGGGGNICAFAAQGPYVLGAAYAGGLVHVLDTRKDPTADPNERNPRLLFADARIHRPRCAVAHPDGEHVLYGGFPGYGSVGGALGIVSLREEKVIVYPHDTIVPFQSTLGLAMLSSGDVIGGTSVETPGGAEPLAGEAVLYRLNWRDRRVDRKWTPIPGAKEISLIVSDHRDRIHGLTSDSIYFVFDPVGERLLHRQDLSGWGRIVRQGLVSVGHGEELLLYGLLSGALFAISPDTFETVLLGTPPKEATSGLAHLEGKLYFGCGSELWEYSGDTGGGERL